MEQLLECLARVRRPGDGLKSKRGERQRVAKSESASILGLIRPGFRSIGKVRPSSFRPSSAFECSTNFLPSAFKSFLLSSSHILTKCIFSNLDVVQKLNLSSLGPYFDQTPLGSCQVFPKYSHLFKEGLYRPLFCVFL